MATAQIEINPINLTKDSIKLLTKAAASDAKHDFAKSFLDVFQNANFKKIGTTQDPDVVNDEHGTLHLFLSDTSKALIHPDNKFNTAIFSETGKSTTEGITLNKDFGSIHTYTLHAQNIDTAGFTGESLMTFLTDTFTSGKAVYVQQDATSIGIKDKLGESDDGVAGQFTFYFMNSREGQNDAAGKTGEDDRIISTTVGKKVKVAIQNEVKDTKQIHYPSLDDSSTGRTLDYTNNFNSIFNIELSPIIVEGTKSKRVIMYFRDKENKLVGSTNKGKAENAKGNLKDVLTTFYKLFTNAQKKLSADTHSYWQSLQQKRGGDWLQALSTYDKSRFGLTEDQNIILMTHDLIALAYALANGVNVLFTYSYKRPGGNSESWILLFQNEQTAKPKGFVEYINELNSLESGFGVPGEFDVLKKDINSYILSRNLFKADLENGITDVNNSLSVKIPGINGDNISAKVQPIIQELFTAYFNYSYYMQMFPEAQTFVSELFTVTDAGVVTVNDTYTYSKQLFTELRNKYSIEIRRCMEKVKNTYPSLKAALERADINGKSGEKVPNIFGRASIDTLTYKDYLDFRNHLLPTIPKELINTIDALDITILETDKAKQTLKLNEIQSEIKAQERFLGKYLTIKKSVESYKIGTGGYDLIRIKNYSKKIKTKDLENINYFLKNLNPFVISLKREAETAATTLSIPTNRFKEAINHFRQEVKDVFKNKQERSMNDYSVFNYFIGNQIETDKKNTIIANLTSIKARLGTIIDTLPPEGATATGANKRTNRIKAFAEQFTNFITEVSFHLKGDTSITYQQGLLSDLVEQLRKLVTDPPPAAATEGGSQRGGETPVELKIVLSFVSDLMKKKDDGTYTIDNDTAILNILNKQADSIKEKLKVDAGRTNVQVEEVLDDVTEKLGKYGMGGGEDTKGEIDVVIEEILREKAETAATAATQAEEAATRARESRDTALAAIIAPLQGLGASIRGFFSTYTNESIEPEVEYVDETVKNEIDSTVVPEDAETTQNGSNFVQTTPASLYIDMITNVRDNPSFSAGANVSAKHDFDTIIQTLGNAEEVEVEGQGGGARRLLTLPPGMNLPYLGWITLFFHTCTILEILQDTNDVTEGIDFPFLARQAQFLLALNKARYSMIQSPRGGSKTRKQKGAARLNQITAVTTTLSRPTNRPVSYANAMNKIQAQEKQINSKINSVLKDYQLGRDCDALLTYFISNIEEVPGYNEATLMKVLGIGSSPLWLISSISTINENYFNWGFDPTFKETQYSSSTLPTLLQSTFNVLASMPPIEFSNEGKQQIERELYQLISSLVSSIRDSEHGLLSSIYKHILMNRLDETLQESVSRTPTLSQREAIYKEYYENRSKIIQIPFEKFDDLPYLITNKLIPERVTPKQPERKSTSELQILRTIKEPRAEKIQRVTSLLTNDSALREKYMKQLQNLEALKVKGTRSEFKQLFTKLLEFYENPSRTNLLSGGTRKQKSARLKSRSRTHKKI